MATLDPNVVASIQKALDNNDTRSAVSAVTTYLKDINNHPLNIAVTGESGSGKSTFVNVFRGVDNRDEGAAATGVVETTTESKSYPHPSYPNVIIWDLPGIGTPNFLADKYLERVKFERFDFFIIVSADRFRQNDAKLAQEIMNMGKKLYFVRSKIDSNLYAEKRSQREYDEEKTLQKIRRDCIQGLPKQGVEAPQVFLCSLFDLDLYEFNKLQETMLRELPSHKRDVLILALPNICKSNIKKKTEVFRERIHYHALLSGLAGAVPIPGLSFAADISILVSVLNDYLPGLGLDSKSLEKLSSRTNTPLEDIKRVMKSEFSVDVMTGDVLIKILASLSGEFYVPTTAEKVIKWIPFIGLVVSVALSYNVTHSILTFALDSLSEDAENVLVEALKKPLAR